MKTEKSIVIKRETIVILDGKKLNDKAAQIVAKKIAANVDLIAKTLVESEEFLINKENESTIVGMAFEQAIKSSLPTFKIFSWDYEGDNVRVICAARLIAISK